MMSLRPLIEIAMTRNRIVIAGLIPAVVLLGLATRITTLPWPTSVSAHGGDALWAVLIYLLLVFFRPTTLPLRVALTALVISFAVEFSQLLQFDGLVALRQTLPGRLVLGQGFVSADLLRYTAGIALALAVDLFVTAFTPNTERRHAGD